MKIVSKPGFFCATLSHSLNSTSSRGKSWRPEVCEVGLYSHSYTQGGKCFGDNLWRNRAMQNTETGAERSHWKCAEG